MSLSSDDNTHSMVYRSSFLSTHSRSLLCFEHPDKINSPEFPTDYIINFDQLPNSLITPLLQEQYELALIHARPFMHKIATCFNSTSTYQLYTQHGSLLSWLSDPYEYLELHSRLPQQEASEKLLIGLRLTALLDFSLNALLWHPSTKSPNMLKETLQSKKLVDLLGTNCILILKLLFGSVHSLNLRNILWHGFLTPTDMLHMDQCLIPFTFAVILSIGYRLNLSELGQKFNTVSQRPSSLELLNLCDTVISDDHLNFPSTSLVDLAIRHPIASTSNLEYIKFIDVMFQMESPRYFDILCLSLVCLSMIIRCQFAKLIKWAEGVMTAEDRFFLTLDSIMEFQFGDIIHHLPSLDLMVNLDSFCDLHVIDILCDILSAPNGPRLKDKLSHGEFWQPRPIEFAHHQLIVPNDSRFSTASKLIYSCLSASLVSGILCQNDDPLISSALSWIQFYRPRFNLCSQFMQNLSNLDHHYSVIKNLMHSLSDFVCPNGLHSASSSYEEFESTFLSWFPQNTYSISDQPKSLVPGQHWFNILSWSYLITTETDIYSWSFRPTSLLNRLNLVLQKYNHAFSLVDQHFNRFDSTDLDNLPTRRYNTFVRSTGCLHSLSNLIHFLLNLTNSIWFFWLGGGLCQNIQDKLDLIGKYCVNLQERALLIENLDKLADKLIMWTTKSQWQLITDFFNDFKLPKPRSVQN